MTTSELNRISRYSIAGTKVQNLACLIKPDSLRGIHEAMDGKKAVGIDGITKEDYSENLDNNLTGLYERLVKEVYSPLPSKRVYIDKAGSNKKRPLGISAYEDKLVEANIAEILNAVYEPKFLPCSYGFRLGRNCH